MNYTDFYRGTYLDAWEDLGAHLSEDGVRFRVFAPNASRVSLLLEDMEIVMKPVHDGNFYEILIPQLKTGTPYEYRIYRWDGTFTDHADPYGFACQLRPQHKSLVTDPDLYVFEDEEWMTSRSVSEDQPLNIYELHAGSWKKPEDGTWYRYDELADLLIPYLKETGYTHVELLPVTEHPSDESWGYQTTGFFAPTSRYGTGDDLKRLIDRLHQNGIGVILDFTPTHFAMDAWGLAQFDGSALYEYPSPDVGNSEWGTCNFMHSRGEVRSFLASAANFWLKKYHFDGIRMDAVSRLIYWQGDESRGENGNAIDFLKVMNRELKQANPDCILIAEDSTNYPGVTKAVDQGGLGFDCKWDLGWMHDTLDFFQTAPLYRPKNYHKLTFSMLYFPNDRYLLPLSHDEVVHGKATILQKMNGPLDQKFPQARCLYLYMMVHPGKKLNFMGNEFGQLREWSEKREQDWDLLKVPDHRKFHDFMVTLNRLYLEHPALYELDYDPAGFRWLDCAQESRCIYAMERLGKDERVAAIFNLSDRVQIDYQLDLPGARSFRVLLDTDWAEFGGRTEKGKTDCRLKQGKQVCTLQPFSAILIRIENDRTETETATDPADRQKAGPDRRPKAEG